MLLSLRKKTVSNNAITDRKEKQCQILLSLRRKPVSDIAIIEKITVSDIAIFEGKK